MLELINKFQISKILMTIFLLIYSLLLAIGFFGNPFSDEEIKGIYLSVNEDKIDWKERKNIGTRGKYKESYDSYFNELNQKKIKLLKGDNLGIDCNDSEYAIRLSTRLNSRDCVPKKNIKNPNVHPINSFYEYNGNYMVLGTIAKLGDSHSGIDRLTYLSKSIYQTTKLSIYALITFVFFGILFAISIGYYGNRFIFLGNFNNLIMTIFQCVPITLWILILVILMGYTTYLSQSFKLSIYFLFFGLVSSPALAKLIIEKINQMKSEDFIVALKLLGLKDSRIIFSHMLKYYCKSIIIFQMAYIMAHSFFLDLTLSFIEQGSAEPATFGYYATNNTSLVDIDFAYVIILSFMLIVIFYYIADFFKRKAN